MANKLYWTRKGREWVSDREIERMREYLIEKYPHLESKIERMSGQELFDIQRQKHSNDPRRTRRR